MFEVNVVAPRMYAQYAARTQALAPSDRPLALGRGASLSRDENRLAVAPVTKVV
jgi:hypothetical protein